VGAGRGGRSRGQEGSLATAAPVSLQPSMALFRTASQQLLVGKARSLSPETPRETNAAEITVEKGRKKNKFKVGKGKCMCKKKNSQEQCVRLRYFSVNFDKMTQFSCQS